MSPYLSGKLRTAVVILALLVILTLSVVVAQANVRLGDGGDVPFYARIERGGVITDGEWVAVIFYRPPDCVPDDFNLLDFFDAPRVFGCQPYTTDGFSIWKNGPDVDPAPLKSHLHGLGSVPVWFVSWPDMEAGLADDALTIVDLEDMPSLMAGTAGFYTEELHPSEGVAGNPMLQLVARGQLADGRSFSVNALSVYASGHFDVTIRFK